ncbi:Nuclear pore complex protein NUP98B [Smittium culicis]|uniref:Nuclear pore complex protein NUP98B n=1 Tax=Smittium culicis TaxID=133412 RepID=A0A1R1X9I4_9FUNG|nr:Nuclear pore complex protein NUP98B [Smittium culicis]
MQIRASTIEEPSSANAFSGNANRVGTSFAPASSFGASSSAFESRNTASAFSSAPTANLMSIQQRFGASAAPATMTANDPASSGFSFASAFQSPPTAAPAAAFQASGFGAASQSAFGNSSGSAFGNSTSSAFGNSNSSAFGNPTSSAFGNSNSSAFGNSAGSAFGMSINPQQSAFGQSSMPGSGQVQAKNSAFGAASSSTPMKFPSSGFGTSGFGVSSSQSNGSAFGASSTFASNSSFFQQQSKKAIFSKTIINGIYEYHSQFGPSADIIKQCICGKSSDGVPSEADILAYKQPDFELNCVPEFPPPYELIAPN